MENTDVIAYNNNPKYFLLCPFCLEELPLLSLAIINDEIVIRIKCSCLKSIISHREIKLIDFMQIAGKVNQPKKEKCIKHLRKLIRFCPDCMGYLCSECLSSHWIQCVNHNILLDNYINIKCMLHQRKYSFYCVDCDSNICFTCNYEHLHHNRIDIAIELIGLSQCDFYIDESDKEVNGNSKLLKQFYDDLVVSVCYLKHYPTLQLLSFVNTMKDIKEILISDPKYLLKPYEKDYSINKVHNCSNKKMNDDNDSSTDLDEEMLSI